MSRRDDILARVGQLPGLPTSALDLSRLLGDPEYDVEEIVRVVERDPALAANVLRLANSAYFGQSRTVSSVRDAIRVVGANAVYQIAFASSLAPLMRTRIRGYDISPEQLWKHSVGVAEMALRLASKAGVDAPSHTFTAALVHDIGKVVLGTYFDLNVEQITDLAYHEQVPFDGAERAVLGIDHAEVGSALLKGWNLPDCVCEVVRWHHDPDAASGEPTAVDLVHVVDVLSLMGGVGIGRDGLSYQVSDGAVSRLGITGEVGEEVLCQVAGTLDKTAALSSPVGDAVVT